MMNNEKKYTCPCCGYCTLSEEPPGSYDICEICFWEDDNVQFNDPDFAGGANDVSLRQAQHNFIKFGCSEKRFKSSVREPRTSDAKDNNWHHLPKVEGMNDQPKDEENPAFLNIKPDFVAHKDGIEVKKKR